MSRVVFAFMWLGHFLPLRAQALLGDLVGTIFYWLIHERRMVTRINLEKCFPRMTKAEREKLARAHFRVFCRSFIERGLLWWAPRERLERLVRLEGIEHLKALAGKPVIIVAPHFVGFDASVTRLAMDFQMSGMYTRQKDPLFERLMYQGRKRFGGTLLPRQAGIRPALRAIKANVPYFILPDQDVGPKSSVFVPFFGVPAATTTGLAYIARATGAQIVPCVTRMLRDRYVVRLYPAWSGYPSEDDVADARRLLAFIEERVLEMPEQYFWLHKRFKTRPEGEPRFY
jgi:Kdo2-lipid IVA lauroyltransferase/acyltransferase